MQVLENKVVLVTGAGRGIGRGIAEAIAEAGGRVVATDIDAQSAEETAARIRDLGQGARSLGLDVTIEASFQQAVQHALDELGRLDGLVNNAGTLAMGPALDTSSEQWQSQLAVNVIGVANGCKIAARHMREAGGGSIVNIASNAGKVGYPNMAAYNASKAAVINMTRSFAAEWAAYDINVNAVCPGGVSTPMLSEVAAWLGPRFDQDPEEVLATMVPKQLDRHIQPLEVGRVVAFLLSPHATVIRGQAINVDGGDTPY